MSPLLRTMMSMLRLGALGVLVSTLVLGTVLAPVPASAEDAGITSTLPPSVTVLGTVRLPFTVTAPAGVCDIEAFGSNLDLEEVPGGYVLVLDSARMGAGPSTAHVEVMDCNDDWAVFSVAADVPFTANSSLFVAPWGDYGNALNVEVDTAGPPVTVTLLRNSKVFDSKGPFTSRQDVSFKVSKAESRGVWSLRVQGGDQVYEQPVTVARKWSPMGAGTSIHFPLCSTVTWSYDSANTPASVKGMPKDIKAAFAQLAKYTGLTFQQVPSGGDIQLSFKDFNASQPAGYGGYNWSYSSEGQTITGTVEFNTRAQWLRYPGTAPVRAMGGVPGRGVLIVHELGHVLGLGHVDDPSQVMYPITGPRSPAVLKAGDKAGLRALYSPQSCPR